MKNTLRYLTAVLALLVLSAIPAFGQAYTLTQTTLSANINASVTSFSIASATNVTVTQNTNATDIYIDRELMQVTAVSGTVVTVIRGVSGTQASGHASGTMVLSGAPPAFLNYDPEGYCSIAPTVPNVGQSIYVPAQPTINTRTGNQWLCSSVTNTWVPGFVNQFLPSQMAVTAAVASVAGATLPSGPLFHVTGTNAITSWTVPVGCNGTGAGGCQFTIIPDAVCTWTNAGNIALGGSCVVNKALTFIWDAKNSKWIPSYIA